MNEREKLLFLYTGALERGDMETVAAILRDAASDAELGKMIEEINQAYADEPPTYFSNSANKGMLNMIAVLPRRNTNTSGLTLMVAAMVTLLLLSLTLFIPDSFNGVTPQTAQPQNFQQIAPENIDRLTQSTVLGRGGANDVALSPDGETVAVSTSMGIFLHHVVDGSSEPFGTYRSPLRDIEYSPDGTLLASVVDDDLTLWNVRTGEIAKVIENDFLPVFTFSPDGKQILAGRMGCTSGAADDCQRQQQIVLLDIEKEETSHLVPEGIQYINTLTFSPDGSLIAFDYGTDFEDNAVNVQVWQTSDVGQEDAVPVMEFATSRLSGLAISPDNLYILSTRGLISLWSLESKELVQVITRASRSFPKAVFSPDGKFVNYMDLSYPILKSWNIETKQLDVSVTLPGENPYPSDVQFEFSVDNHRLMTRGDQEIAIWDVENQTEPRLLLKLDDYSFFSRNLSIEGTTFMGVGWGYIELWDAVKQEKTAKISTYADADFVEATTALNSEATIAYFSFDESHYRLMYLKNGETLATDVTFETLVDASAFDIANQLLVFDATNDGLFITRIIEDRVMGTVELEVPFKVFKGVDYSIVDSTFSPDGRLLVTSLCYVAGIQCETEELLVFDTQTGELLGTIAGIYPQNANQPLPLLSVGYNEGTGQYHLASTLCLDADREHCMTAWDITPMLEGEPANMLFSQWDLYLARLNFSPDLKMLVAATNGKSVKIWNVETGTIIRELDDIRHTDDAVFNEDMTQLAVYAEGIVYLLNIEE